MPKPKHLLIAPANIEQHDVEDLKEGDRDFNVSTLEIIRGEDDPRTLQAIEEGCRLYVGNLAYMAKRKDIEDLFVGNGYRM